MKKFIVFLLFQAFAINAFGQEADIKETPQTCEAKPNLSFIQSQSCCVTGTIQTGDSPPGQRGNIVLSCQGTTLPEEPLYVIDGIVSDVDTFKNIKPEDIINVSVLKDATTAITTCRNSNGVIIVKTKNGLTKRELRKLKRQLRRDARKQANALK